MRFEPTSILWLFLGSLLQSIEFINLFGYTYFCNKHIVPDIFQYMKVHRFFVEDGLSNKELVVTDKTLVSQMSKVLRLTQGEKVIIIDGSRYEAGAEIKFIDKRKVILHLDQKMYGENEPINKVHLYPSILKKDNFEFAVLKAVECGAFEITPILSMRTEKKNLSIERLSTIAKEAVEQSERSMLVKVNKINNFEKALSDAPGTRIILSKDGIPVLKVPKDDQYSIFIGPEGGFTKEELETASRLKAIPVSLGKTTLRAETATIISSYLFANRT